MLPAREEKGLWNARMKKITKNAQIVKKYLDL